MAVERSTMPVLPPAPPSRSRVLVKGLFGSVTNTAITLAILAVLAVILPELFRWAVLDSLWAPASPQSCIQGDGACWAFIQDKARLILFGRYPPAEHWRPILAMALWMGAIAVSADWRQWGRRHWPRFLLVLWAAVLLVDAVLMAGGAFGLREVPLEMWSGLPLTIMIATFGLSSAFVLSIFLALGRRSRLPVVRWLSIGYIEIIRGVPLISILFMAAVVLPIILPPDLVIDKIVRAQVAFFLFFAAYMAETIRGGLQSIPKGQYEAADALAMSYWQSMRRIIVPQALRVTVPSMVNIFISAFKDTSLVVIISMHDLLGTTNAATNDPVWLGVYVEAYVFTALIYLVFCFMMSWYSQRLEVHIKTGRR
ncbi:amino acid ABC transporter permease [Geminicoccaceae bacterium 1502E]|nr:amino acid ABC transporter permease [Geminicoccaceae bacterium 1502E]